MADVSKIITSDGSTLDIKDAIARGMIIQISQSDYNNLTPQQRAGKVYFVYDAGGSGTIIDDTVTSQTSVWSSYKVSNELNLKANSSSLATVATSGSYTDLLNPPTIPDISGKVDKAGDTMTGQLKTSTYSSVAMGSYGSSQNTIPNFCNEIRKSSGATGSVNITTAFTKNNVTISAGWYNFIYSPHRSGGNNGQESGDNTNYGTLILNTMNASYNDAATYILRVSNSSTNNYVEHVRKIIDSHLFKSGTYVANFSANTVHITFANMGVSSRPSAVICTVQSLSNAFICYDFDNSSTDITLHIQNNTNTSISGNVRFGYIVCP